MLSLVYDPISTELLVRKNKKFFVYSNGAVFSNLVLTKLVRLTSGYVTVNDTVVILTDSTVIVSDGTIVEIV